MTKNKKEASTENSKVTQKEKQAVKDDMDNMDDIDFNTVLENKRYFLMMINEDATISVIENQLTLIEEMGLLNYRLKQLEHLIALEESVNQLKSYMEEELENKTNEQINSLHDEILQNFNGVGN